MASCTLENQQKVNVRLIVGERTVLELISPYKNSGRNVTTDNFFTSLELAKTLTSWNLTLVGTVRRNKRFLPANMQAHKDRLVYYYVFIWTYSTLIFVLSDNYFLQILHLAKRRLCARMCQKRKKL